MYGELGAIDSLLQQLAYYKRHDPNQQEEFELMENLFNCLCSLLAEKDNRDRYMNCFLKKNSIIFRQVHIVII